MKVLITGANGFLGSWLTRRLCEEGHTVSVLVRPTSQLDGIEDLSLQKIYGDITDAGSLQKAFSSQEVIFHLAGLIAYKAADRPAMERVNVQGTANVLAAMKSHPGQKLVYASSVVAIGAARTSQVILNENSKYDLENLNLGYFETKRKAEILVQTACYEDNLQAIIVNPSTIYGAGDAKKGSRKTQIKVAQGRFPFYTGGGVNVVPVESVINGILLAWKKGRVGERYILAGQNYTIRELFQMIADAAGVRAPQKKMPFWLMLALGKAGDVCQKFGMPFPISSENAWTANLFHWFDSTKAQQELGFDPGNSQQAIVNSVLWMKKQGLIQNV